MDADQNMVISAPGSTVPNEAMKKEGSASVHFFVVLDRAGYRLKSGSIDTR